MSLGLEFYEDDEGVSVDLTLSLFGPFLIQCINLESDSVDEKMKKDIDFLIKKQNDFFLRKSQLKPRHIASAFLVRMQKTSF